MQSLNGDESAMNDPASTGAPIRRMGFRVAVLAGALFALTWLLYARVVDHEFIGYDDPLYVHNPVIQRGLTSEGVRWSLTIGPGRQYFHPLTWASHMLDAEWFPPSRPGAYHAVSAVLHAAAAALLLIALWRLSGAVWPSFVAAALFAWHPLHVQSVAWLAERKDVVSAVTFFLALVAYSAYAARPRAGRYALLLIAAALALASKPTLVTLPCVLLLLDHWPLERLRGRVAIRVAEKLPIFLMAIAVAVISYRLQLLDATVKSAEVLPLRPRIDNAIVSYVRYLYQTVWPVKLAIFYPYRTWAAWQVIGSAVVLASITAFAWVERRRRPYLLIGWLWFLGMLVPMIGLVQVGSQAMADRYTYLPLIGVFIMASWLAAEWAQPAARRRGPVVALTAAALFLTAAGTAFQLRFWKNDYVLFSRALQVTDDNYLAHGYVAHALVKRGDDAAAEDHYRTALSLAPNYYEAHYNFGNLLMRHGRADEARRHYEAVVALKPDFVPARSNLAALLASAGELSAAEAHLRTALAADPARGDVLANLGRVLLLQGRPAEAANYFRRAIALQPTLDLARRGLEEATSRPPP